MLTIKSKTGKKAPKGVITPIELDPQKDYILVVSSSISEEEYTALCSQFDTYTNVIVVAAESPIIIHLK